MKQELLIFKMHLFQIVFVALLSACTWAADVSEIDYEIWDLMDGVVKLFGGGKTFYDAFEVDFNAPSAEIQKVYRKKSLSFHPDKNPTEEAAVMFQVSSFLVS
jgi:hypothetical protein